MNQKSKTARARPSERRERAARRGTLNLGSTLTVKEVREQAQAMKRLLGSDAPEHTACLDARSLESIDTAGLQLLVAAAASAQRRGRKLQLLGGERVLDGAAEALGIRAPLLTMLEVLP